MKRLTFFLAFSVFLVARGQACNTCDRISEFNSSGSPVAPILYGRPSDQFDWITPDGRFHIHYDLTGVNAVYHPNEDLNPHDGIPDYVNRCADYFALAYDSLVITLGFDPPPFDHGQGGDSLYDIYLTDNPGLTTPEDPSGQYPGRPAYTSYIQLGHDLRYPSRYGDDPYPFMMVSVAHEYFHAIEFGYRAYSTDYTPWWFEACANWAEERVFDSINDVYYSLPTYLSNPQFSLYRTSGRYIYGTWLFPEYLSERFGSGIIVQAWQRFAHFDFALNAINMVLSDIGQDLNSEYCRHVVWNFFTGGNSQSGFYQEGANFDTTVYIARTYVDYPVGWVNAPIELQNMSSSYIVFERNDNGRSTLLIDYNNPTSDLQSICLAIVRSGEPVQFGEINIPGGNPQTLAIRDFSSDVKVILIPVWLYEDNPKEDFSTYQYSAHLSDTLTSVSDGNGQPVSEFALNRAYPNPFNGTVSISFNAPGEELYLIHIYDITGRAVFQKEGISQSGQNLVAWQAPNDLSSGVLFYVIDCNQRRLEGKLVLLK